MARRQSAVSLYVANVSVIDMSRAEPNISNFYVEFGRRLRAARDAADLSQKDLAEAVGLGRTSITNIERGDQPVAAHVLVKLARVLDTDPAALLPEMDQTGGSDAVDDQMLKGLDDDIGIWTRRIVNRAN